LQSLYFLMGYFQVKFVQPLSGCGRGSRFLCFLEAVKDMSGRGLDTKDGTLNGGFACH